ncbi:MAG: FAD-dependent oxidoreductase, partial [Steroidobacteraceae bacterium]
MCFPASWGACVIGPANRRAGAPRVEEKPVAICRLKRVAADHRDDITGRLPRIPQLKNGKRVALIGAGCASLTVANDLLPLGYEVTVFEQSAEPGGLMRTNIPSFRLPQAVLDDEMGQILGMGVDLKLNHPIRSMRELLRNGGFDAVFVGSGAPKGKELSLPGRTEAAANVHIGIAWLESVAFGHTTAVGSRVLIIGVGNTAMDCCRTSLRLGASSVKVMARKPRAFFKASAWELEDAEAENVEIVVNYSPKSFVVASGRLTGMMFDRMEYEVDARGAIVREHILGEEFLPADDVILAIGQENSFPWIERDLGIEFDKWDVPVVDKRTFQSTRPGVFFGGDAAFGPKNIIWAVEHGHQAAISIHRLCQGESPAERLPPGVNLQSRKMGMHEWSYSNDYAPVERRLVPHVSLKERFKKINIEVELGFTAEQAAEEVQRCLNCDMQTVFTAKLCIECDACIDICPVDCLTMTHNGEESDLRTRLKAPAKNLTQPLLVLRPAAANRSRDGEGRGPVRSLWSVRRALSHRRLGYAKIPGTLAARPGRSARAAGRGTQDSLKGSRNPYDSFQRRRPGPQ